MANRGVFKPSFFKRALAIFPVNLADEAEVDAWFLRRLPLVIDEGSPAFPKPRYRDPR
jgi:hypothetical protein